MRDIGSANGTTLNGVELEPLVDTPLKAGDEITLGHWTRLTVQIIH
jgi:pSer/pThr/pTyr-binding forkhead associated (FHA) protein